MIIDLTLLPEWLQPALIALATSGTFTYIFREWISTRLKASIGHEFNEKLQEHKHNMDAALQHQRGEFEINLQKIRLEHEANLTKSSMFFDHQRGAFVDIIEAMTNLLDAWGDTYDDDLNLLASVPEQHAERLRILFHRHQLFLDPDSSACIRLLFEIYRESRPYQDITDGPLRYRDTQRPYEGAEYLQSRIASLFQNKIGAPYDENFISELAIFGLVFILRRYRRHLPGSNLLQYLTDDHVDPEHAVKVARDDFAEFQNLIKAIEVKTTEAGIVTQPYHSIFFTLRAILLRSANS